MPKRNIIQIKLPPMQPDCCAECPLLGEIPNELRQHRSKETMVCLGTMEAMTRIGSRVRASQKDVNHKLHRPCDNKYSAWLRLPKMQLGIQIKAYNECRVPYEQGLQLQIKFHK